MLAFVFLSFLFLVICSLICVYRKISFLYHLLCYDSHSSSNRSRIVFVFILLLSRFVSPVSARRLCQCLCHCFVPNLVLFFSVQTVVLMHFVSLASLLTYVPRQRVFFCHFCLFLKGEKSCVCDWTVSNHFRVCECFF